MSESQRQVWSTAIKDSGPEIEEQTRWRTTNEERSPIQVLRDAQHGLRRPSGIISSVCTVNAIIPKTSDLFPLGSAHVRKR